MTEQAPAQAAAPALSPALAAAQQHLLALRQQLEAARLGACPEAEKFLHGRCSPPSPAPIDVLPVNGLPPHLGWISARVTSVLRVAQERHAAQPDGKPLAPRSTYAPNPAPLQNDEPACLQTAAVKLHPSLALGMLRAGQAAAGRLWLLLRYLDAQGRGWVDLEAARQQLTQKGAPLRICGRRQLRHLLTQGEMVFWARRGPRIWLRSTAKAAAALGVSRLSCRPVAVPLDTLTQGMGAVRAHFYASFHSGRRQAMPIARATLARLSSVRPRTQRSYEKRAAVQRQANYTIGPRQTSPFAEEDAWQHGTASFHFIDHQGRQGRVGTAYLAWQLPNSYYGPHAPQPRGRQKRINQELAVLFNEGMTGNDQNPVGHVAERAKRFYGSGRDAARARLRRPISEVYWLDKPALLDNGRHPTRRYQLWGCIR